MEIESDEEEEDSDDEDGEYQYFEEHKFGAYRVYCGEKAYKVGLPTEEKFFTTEQKAKDFIDEINSTADIDIFVPCFEVREEEVCGYDIIDKNWYADQME